MISYGNVAYSVRKGRSVMSDKLKVAVLVENHPYDVVSFQAMLDSFENCEVYVQPLDLFIQDEDNKNSYDTVLWYNMNNAIPEPGSHLEKYITGELGEKGQGLIIIHHALLCFQRWEVFTQVCGLRNRGEEGFKYTQNQAVLSKIADTAHPITAGLGDFSLIDETYILGEPTEESGNQILIKTDNETSIKNIAWVREYKKSRVFCYASGHDNNAYANPSFRQVLHKAILWTSKRI